MQEDMHFYGTYVISRAAGIPKEDAFTIAYAAQFVDDSTSQDSERHQDGGLLYGIATAHHDVQCVVNSKIDPEEQRRVWVPFHFLPGGIGISFEEKLLCVMDSNIAQELFQHHIDLSANVDFRFELLGIASHVYMDTFSHYGFSGIGSEYNDVDEESIEFVGVQNPEMKQYLLDKRGKFVKKFHLRSVASFLSEKLTSGLGHGAVATYPDRPFLHWKVNFTKERAGIKTVSDRDNPKTYLEGCRKLHGYLSSFARKYYDEPDIEEFENFNDEVERVLQFEGNKKERINIWKSVIRSNSIFNSEADEFETHYDHNQWEDEKKNFHNLTSSTEGTELNVYRFHQAAALHRYYVLKQLLPAHGITVY